MRLKEYYVTYRYSRNGRHPKPRGRKAKTLSKHGANIMEKLFTSFAKKMEDEFINGTGDSKPVGMLK